MKVKPECFICKASFEPRNSLQKACKKHLYDHAMMEIKKAELKKKTEQKKIEKAKDKQTLYSLMTLTDFEKEAKKTFQLWVRKRDKEPCISCGSNNPRRDAGHYWDAGQYSGLIFHPDNCHAQCSNFCNRMNHGNKLNYRIGLIKKIGIERVEWLDTNRNLLKTFKYTKFQLEKINQFYKDKIKSEDYTNEFYL